MRGSGAKVTVGRRPNRPGKVATSSFRLHSIDDVVNMRRAHRLGKVTTSSFWCYAQPTMARRYRHHLRDATPTLSHSVTIPIADRPNASPSPFIQCPVACPRTPPGARRQRPSSTRSHDRRFHCPRCCTTGLLWRVGTLRKERFSNAGGECALLCGAVRCCAVLWRRCPRRGNAQLCLLTSLGLL